MPSPWPAEARRTLLPYVSFVLTGMINTIFGPLLPWLTARFALSDAEAGLLFTLELTASVAAGIGSGLAVARCPVGARSRRRDVWRGSGSA